MKTFLVVGSLLVLECALASSTGLGRLTVRVDASSGAPRLVVNGRSVRARMFFGGPGSAPLRVEPAGSRAEFEFTAENDSQGAGTLHFRFGQVLGDIFLDNICIVDVASGREVVPTSDFQSGESAFLRDWNFWPQGAANAVGTVKVESSVGADGTAGLHVKLRAPAAGAWPDWHIYHRPNMTLASGHRYRVSFWARAEPARDLTVALYRPGDPYVHLGGPPSVLESQIKLAAAAGVDFVSFPVGTPWPAPGESADWRATDAACEQVLAANPKPFFYSLG